MVGKFIEARSVGVVPARQALVPANPVVKYKEIYPRDMAEVVIKKVQP